MRRAGRSALVLTIRDIDLLTLTGLVRFLSADQLAREFFPSADRGRRRLRDLFDAGYLHVAVGSSQIANIVSLTREGLAAVTEARPALAPRVGRSGMIRLRAVSHHLAVVDLRLYAAALGLARKAPLVRWSNAGSDRFEQFGFKSARLVPDALAEFETARGPVAVAMEVDLGTEAMTVLAKKCERYAALSAQGQVDALWAYVAAGPGRRASIAALLDAHGLGGWSRVLGAELVRARPVRELPARAQGPKETGSARVETESPPRVADETPAADGSADRTPDGRGR